MMGVACINTFLLRSRECRLVVLATVFTVFGLTPVQAQDTTLMWKGDGLDLSLRLEARSSLLRGGRFLLSRQNENGSWAGHPIITALAAAAVVHSPLADQPSYRNAVTRALDFIVAQAHPDGSIWDQHTRDYPLFCTALCTTALVAGGRERDVDVLRGARDYMLASQQRDHAKEHPAYGGFDGLGREAPSLVVSQWVLEALYFTDFLDQPPLSPGPEARATADEAYSAAIVFISRCQYFSETGDAPAGSEGFFADSPYGANAVPPAAPGTPRSRAMLTCAGLKSLRHAGVPREDRRVRTAWLWLTTHYTVSTNPGLGESGYYTYLFALTKALKAMDDDPAQSPPDRPDWPRDIVLALLQRQHGNGTWQHSRPEWWESHPELVTAYAMLMLQAAGVMDAEASQSQAQDFDAPEMNQSLPGGDE